MSSCMSSAYCFSSLGNTGLTLRLSRFTDGILNPMIWVQEDGVIPNFGSAVFHLLYMFLITIVLTAIISGIIIDTFAQMRSDSKEVDEDLASSCFICDIEPEDFEACTYLPLLRVTRKHS